MYDVPLHVIVLCSKLNPYAHIPKQGPTVCESNSVELPIGPKRVYNDYYDYSSVQQLTISSLHTSEMFVNMSSYCI